MTVTAVIVIVVILAIGGFVLLSNNNPPANNTTQTPVTAPTPTPTPTPAPTGTSSKADISIDNMSFPAVTTINKGQTVLWTNNDSIQHTVTFNTISVDSGTLNPGDTFSHQFNDVGTFVYHCKFHSNMVATIVVQ